MRILSSVALLIALLGGSPAVAEEDMKKIFPYAIETETLDNGLKVVLVPMASEGLVSYWTIVRTGARDEYEAGYTGFAHFFEHMMFRGTERYPQDKYNEEITRMGADANAFTSNDLTAYHLNVTSDVVEKVMELESDRFQNLSYPVGAFKTEAGAVYGEYRKNRMNPFFAISEAMRKEAFEKHTYGHTAMGYEEDIKNMPEMFDYSRSFFKRHYRPENCVLLIAGDIESAATMDLVRKYYGGWEPGYVEPEIPVEPEQKAEKRIDVAYPGRTLPIVWMGYKSGHFDPADKTWVAGMLLGPLAFGQTSDLFKKLVLDEQVIEFVQGRPDMSRDPGLFSVITRIKDPEKVDYVVSEIDRVIAGFQESPPDAGRLADEKSNVKYSFLMGLETPDNVASSLSRIIAATGGTEAIETMYRTLDAVTPEDVQAAARAYLTKERRTLAILRAGGAQ
ncbi:peptidase M16 [Acidobacteria bacterium Mor1]|nr:peptidase M16 [Acidobacteria bacterium Mor1]